MLIEQALRLIEKGIHPLRIASGFDKAADLVTKHIETLVENRGNDRSNLIKSAKVALSSKVVSNCK